VGAVTRDVGGHGLEPTRSTSIDLELGFRMGQTHRLLKETWEQQIASLGLSAPLAVMLRAICEQPGSGLRELARRMRTDPMNAKRLFDHLEQEGLVTSSSAASHAQRRELNPTADGLERVAGLLERSAAFRRQLAQLLGESELEQLQHLLVRLEDVLGDSPARPWPRGGSSADGDAEPGTAKPQHEGERA
jgi:DNA-binding MarR family transcriptional regulator